MAYLIDQGIACRGIWTPMHQLPMYQKNTLWHRATSDQIAQSNRIAQAGLSLPSSASLQEEQLDQICGLIEAFTEG